VSTELTVRTERCARTWQKSAEAIVCAWQHDGPVGSSPTGSRTGRPISKPGGNASGAGEIRRAGRPL